MFHSYDLFIVVQYILKKFTALQMEFSASREYFKGVQATGYERYLVIFRNILLGRYDLSIDVQKNVLYKD